MKYVYLLESMGDPEQRYVGVTRDVEARLAAHNAGQSTHTNKFRPWRLVLTVGFSDDTIADDFERYL